MLVIHYYSLEYKLHHKDVQTLIEAAQSWWSLSTVVQEYTFCSFSGLYANNELQLCAASCNSLNVHIYLELVM